MTIEQTLINLAAKHDCTVVSIGINTNQHAESLFDCSFQWNGFSTDGIRCASANGPTIAEAVTKAFDQMEERWTPFKFAVPAIFGGEAA